MFRTSLELFVRSVAVFIMSIGLCVLMGIIAGLYYSMFMIGYEITGP